MNYQKYLKSEYLNLGLDEIRISTITVLNGVSQKMADSLGSLNIVTVYDLAYSTIFANADKITNTGTNLTSFMANEIIPSDVMDGGEQFDNLENVKFEDIQSLKGIGSNNVVAIKEQLNIRTIYDMANWPQYLAAKEIIGIGKDDSPAKDQEIPDELVPSFNEYAVDKTFYTVYTINANNDKAENDLETAISIEEVINLKNPISEKIQTGQMLRYEQSWTPIGMGLGNLLHSLALAPGESTRIAVVNWRRTQRAKTTESISQLESLSNTMTQNRSISEITNSVAREAQSGFSQMNSNTSVTNAGHSSYGIQNMEETLAATGVGALVGAEGGALVGGVAGVGIGGAIGGVAGLGIGSIPGWAVGAGLGGLIGGGTGAIVGGTAGGVGAFLTTADFGSSQENTSLENVTAQTVTVSHGVRDVSASIAQNIMDRTHQYSSSSRNKRASIVQELSQSESENISTRVVTNYNHMHSLTIQYFEVVQMYRVATLLKKSQDCLFVPFKPIENWTIDLLNTFRREILSSSLHRSIVYSFLIAENSTLIISPTIANVFLNNLPRYVTSDKALLAARTELNRWVSDNPANYWTVPKTLYLSSVWYPHPGDGPWWAADLNKAKGTLFINTINGNSYAFGHLIPDVEHEELLLKNIDSITYEIKPNSRNWDWEKEIEQLSNKFQGIELHFKKNIEDESPAFIFKSCYKIDKTYIDGDKLSITLCQFSNAACYEEIIEHLNQNTEYYSKQILKRKNPKLIRNIINNFNFNGDALANQVDPDPVAISDNKLIFALKKPLGKKSGNDLPQRVLKSDLIPVATEGVFAEAVQGRANSAEKLDISRFWNWQDSPIPIVAPEISPIQAGSRATSADVRPGSLDSSLVSNMQPNALPEPGTGTAAILNAISSDMFRDMSGIMQTAQLAQSALEQAQEGTTAAGGQSNESLKNGLELTKDLVGQIIKMNSDYAQLLATTGVGALSGGKTPSPSFNNSGGKSNPKSEGSTASFLPMTDPRTNISNAGAALNAMKGADYKNNMSMPSSSRTRADNTFNIPSSGGDLPLYEAGLHAILGESNSRDYFERELKREKILKEYGHKSHTMTDTFKGYLKSHGGNNIGGTIDNPLLIAKVYFEIGKWDLDKDGIRILRNIIRYSKRDWHLILKGFADEPGEDSDNFELSMKRSNWIQYLLADIRGESNSTDKILVDNISGSGYGERGEGGIHNEENRVVEIYLALLTFEGGNVEDKILEVIGELDRGNDKNNRLICLLEKSIDKLNKYKIGQPTSEDDLYYDYNSIWELVRVQDNEWKRKYGYVESGVISGYKLKLNGKSFTKKMYYNLISTNRNLSEKLEFIRDLEYQIEEGILRLNNFLTLAGRNKCNENAAIYLKNKVIIERSKRETDLYSCFL